MMTQNAVEMFSCVEMCTALSLPLLERCMFLDQLPDSMGLCIGVSVEDFNSFIDYTHYHHRSMKKVHIKTLTK